MGRIGWQWVLCVGAALFTGGCSVVTKDTAEATCDLELELLGFERFHKEELVEVRVLSPGSNQLRARALIDPLGSTEDSMGRTIVMPNAVPKNSHRIDVYADDNRNGQYDDPAADHTWPRLEQLLSRNPCDGALRFEHTGDWNALPKPVSRGADFRMKFRNMPAEGQQFELRVTELLSQRTVGQYFKPSIDASEFAVQIPGIISDESREYQIAFYSDKNGNGSYDGAGVDESWRLTFTSESGIDEVFPYTEGDQVDIELRTP